MSTIHRRLTELGLTIGDALPPIANFVAARRSGDHVYLSGQLPIRDGALIATGKLGNEVDAATGAECARQCALNCLAALQAAIGDLDAVTGIVKLLVLVASTPDFHDHPQVADGASDLLVDLFGQAGHHARSAVGIAALPLNGPVEIEMIVEVNGARLDDAAADSATARSGD
jgi:enamine deaminase RidA (YjgF/YER057c/UK114 family)